MQIKKIRPNAITPTYGSEEAAGFDLYSTIDIMLDPGDRALIPTGLVLNTPKGFEVQVRPRSGMALKHGVVAFFGTVDSDYLGELSVVLFNHSKQTFKVQEGDRIAQGVLAPVCDHVQFEVVDEITKETKRGAGGFGSTLK
jgi:dUTP pyrophosphatase